MRRRRWVLAVLLCAVFAAAPDTGLAAAQSQAAANLDLAGYRAQLGRIADALAKAKDHPAAVSSLRQSLPQAWVVSVNGAQVRVSTAWLDSALGDLANHPDRADAVSRRIETRLAAMRSEAGGLQSSASPPSLATARGRLDAIFRAREFRASAGPSEAQILTDQVVRWILEKIAAFLKLFHVRVPAGNVLGWVLIAAAFAALCFWVVAGLMRRSRSASLRIEAPSAPGDSRRWLEEAQAAAAGGDFREAIHCAYWAAVSRMEDSRLLSRDPARTPRECLRMLQAHPQEQKHLADLTRLLEKIWYGFRPVSAADWSGAKSLLEQMGCLSPSTAQTANS